MLSTLAAGGCRSVDTHFLQTRFNELPRIEQVFEGSAEAEKWQVRLSRRDMRKLTVVGNMDHLTLCQ